MGGSFPTLQEMHNCFSESFDQLENISSKSDDDETRAKVLELKEHLINLQLGVMGLEGEIETLKKELDNSEVARYEAELKINENKN